MDDISWDWHSLAFERPKHGQIVEILVWRPAQCLGDNDLGYIEFREFEELSLTVFWRVSKDPKVYRYVQERLHENH